MRQKEEVLERFHEARSLKLRERKETFLSKIPKNCRHNIRVRIKDVGNVGFCQNPQVTDSLESKVFVCNSDITCIRCRAFVCHNTEKSVEEEFDEILRVPARCGQEYPKLAMLIWFLQEFDSRSRWERLRYALAEFGSAMFRLFFLRWW